jgi:spore germination cell wall hydrolase CwlJ-like protein
LDKFFGTLFSFSLVFLVNKDLVGKESSLQPVIYNDSAQSEPVTELKKQQIKDVLVRQVYHEAKGEPTKGQIATMFIPENRLLSGRFRAKDLVGVVYQKNSNRVGMACEFDWVCDKKSDYVPLKSYQKIGKLVDAYLAGMIKNPCPKAVFYFNPNTVDRKPDWAFDDTVVCRIGNHEFHRALPWAEYKTRLAMADL